VSADRHLHPSVRADATPSECSERPGLVSRRAAEGSIAADLNSDHWGRDFSTVAAKLMKRIPLSEWVTYGAFDNAKECEAERAKREGKSWDKMHQLADEERKTKKKTGDLQMIMAQDAQYWGIARCIASDDSRLRR